MKAPHRSALVSALFASFLLVSFFTPAFAWQQPSAPPPSRTVLVHGHRGSRATRPENTLPAFQFAIEHGADVLELDLAVTKDNVLVVSHSPFLVQPAAYAAHERVCKGPELPPSTAIHTLTLAQVEQYDCGSTTLAAFPTQVAVPGTHIATFDQVLDLVADNKIQLNVETKIFPNRPDVTPSPADFVALIVDAIHRHHTDESRIILQSFDFRTLKEMRKQAPAIRLSALVGTAQYDPLMGITDTDKSFLHIHEITGADILSPDYHLVTPEQVAAAHKAGMQVVPWTANTPEDWRKLVDAGADAIISDDPAALLAWLKSQTPPLH